MSRRAPASLVIAFLLAASEGAAPAQNAPANSERIESGTAESASGAPVHYRIRLLPLASFPGLPAGVAAQLGRRQCMIPQTFEAKQPENVIHGEYSASGLEDWAALCSVSGSTTLYVFFSGEFEAPIAVRSQPDALWIGAEPGSSIYGSAWGIATLSAAQLRSSPQLRRAASFDHDAIDDARLERSEVIRYYESGKWIALNAADEN